MSELASTTTSKSDHFHEPVNHDTDSAASQTSYVRYVNPQWIRLLDLLQMNVKYARAHGVELDREDGKRILDFLSGYCVHNAGHNHPHIIAALQAQLERQGPAMLS